MPCLRHAGALAGVLLLLFVAACSHTMVQVPPSGLPSSIELEETPFFAQQRYQCGPAALATVLVGRGVAVQPDELVEQVYLPERKGSVPIEMEAAARGYGMLVYPLEPSLETLLREIAAGNPVLVLQNLTFAWWPRWHYAVVVGYDLNEGTITLRSGETRRYTVALGVFENTWRRADYWARVVVPPGTFPATATALRYIEAAVALEQSGQLAAALTGFRAASERWPEVALAWLARGNLAYRLQQDNEAEAAFRDGLQAAPDNAVLWNNLGYVLARQRCRLQALAAVRCAIALAPDNPEYRHSFDELVSSADGSGRCTAVSCPAAVR